MYCYLENDDLGFLSIREARRGTHSISKRTLWCCRDLAGLGAHYPVLPYVPDQTGRRSQRLHCVVDLCPRASLLPWCWSSNLGFL